MNHHNTTAMVVLDANILIRAILGQRVRQILLTHLHTVRWVTPSYCLDEVYRHLPTILNKRNIPVQPAIDVLQELIKFIIIVEMEDISPFEHIARQRLKRRDEQDWAIVATALFMDCPIWTEDQDFFGTGIATWTTSTIELFIAPT